MNWNLAILILITIVAIPLVYLYIDSYRLVGKRHIDDNYQDLLNLHFIHASFAVTSSKIYSAQDFPYRWGHVVIELDSFIYGFEYAEKDKIHVVPKKNPEHFNAIFTKESTSTWLTRHYANRITHIQIPIHSENKLKTIELLNKYYKNTPYDYAFWGMRCASSTYEILAKAGILLPTQRWQCILYAFYPGQLRISLTRWAKKNGLKVEYQEGALCRIWE